LVCVLMKLMKESFIGVSPNLSLRIARCFAVATSAGNSSQRLINVKL